MSNGWNKPSGNAKSATTKKPTAMRGALAGLAVIALVGTAAYFVFSGNEKPTVKVIAKKQGNINAVTPAAAPVYKEEPKPEIDHEAERKKLREKFLKMTPDERLEYIFQRAKERPLNTEPSSNRIYSTGLEQTMDWIFTCELGNPPPLLPPMSLSDEAHLAEILISDNPIKEGDSEKVRESKEMMAIAKKEFRNFIKEGGDPYDFLPYYHGQLVKAHQEREQSRQAIMDVLKKDPDIAPDFIKTVNAKLEEKGIKKVQLPQKVLDYFNVTIDE